MLSTSDLNLLCSRRVADGQPCPAYALAQAGEIDLATYAEHRLGMKARLRDDQQARNAVAAQAAAESMQRWREAHRSLMRVTPQGT